MVRQITLRFLTLLLISFGLLTEGQAQVVLVQQAVGGSAGESFWATLPSAPTPNNLLIAIAATRNAGLITPPTGWSTAVNHSGTSGFTRPNQAIFYKIASVSESATVTVTTTANGSGHRNAVQVYEYSGIDTALPFDAANTGESEGTGTTVSSGNVSTTNANDLIIAGLVSRNGTGLTSWANSFTQRNSFTQGAGSAETLFGGADRVVTTSGTYWTAATADASGQWRGVIAAFRAATVVPPPPPTISSLSPTSGPTAGGTSVTIDGTNLGGASSVTFGGAAATITANTSNQITVTTPAAGAGAANVVVTTPGGNDTLANGYTYVAAPTVTSLSPTSGPTAGGTSVTIDGTNLSGASLVTFGGTAATITANTATQVTVTAPGGSAGPVNVVVTTVGGSATLTDGYTYVAAPTMTSLSPTSGPTAGGTSVTIDGTNLGGASSVTFGGAAATITANTATQVTVTAPAGSAGPVSVVVTTVGGSATLTNGYTYVEAPTITSLSPTSGPTAGGTSVTIDGTNLGGASSVTFGGAAATIAANTSNQITVTTPAGVAGAVNVVVTTIGGSGALANGYTYLQVPTLTSLNPTSGPAAGGTSITISGTNLSGASSVTFGGNPGTITANTSSQITVTTPPGAAGAIDVVVTTAAGSPTLTNGYTYVAAPAITSLSPASGPTAGGWSVTIEGTDLSGASAVTFGGTAATITANTSSQITVTAPIGGPGAVNVVVTTIGGTATLPNGYTYVAAPIISNLSPASAVVGDGEITLTVHGWNFHADTTVLWNGSARNTTFLSGTQLSASISASDLASAGIAQVSAMTAQVGQSGAMKFLINNPSGLGFDLSSLVLTPRIVVGGNSSSGIVTLSAPAPPEGALVNLSSSDPATAALPEAVLIPAGESTGAFSIQTLPVTQTTPLVISATIGGVTRTAKLVLTGSSLSAQPGTKMFVPIVLSAAGQRNSFFISELTLTNRGATSAILDFDYQAAIGEGTGFASDVLLPGEQRIVPDAMAYLRSLGVPLPEQGNRGGTLRITAFDLATPASFAVTVRTATRNNRGRAAVAFSGVPRSGCLTTPAYIFGLRQDDSNRSNLAVQNAGDSQEGDIVLRLTVFSGDPATSPQVLPDLTLIPGEFHQINGILVSNGLSLQRGYVRVERVQGTAPYYAYGVVNDESTSDGSFVPPVLETSTQGQTGLILPALVKTGNFISELVLANHSEVPKTLNLSYVPEGGGYSGAVAASSVELQPGEQMFFADFIKFLREQGVTNLGSQDEPVVGTLLVRVAGNDAGGIFAGARTMTSGDERYGVFYTAVPLEKAATNATWIYNLQQDAETRSNVAIVNTGEMSPDADVFRMEIFDGQTGLLASVVDGISVGAQDRIQIGSLLSDFAPGVSNGYVCIVRTDGTNPFIAYGVVNDGGQPGAGTGDGTYLSMDSTP
jgi:IPT/TIG domain